MFRRHQQVLNLRSALQRSWCANKANRTLNRRQPRIERLEERCFLSGTPLVTYSSPATGLDVNGSISGVKWNDVDGDTVKDVTEPGLAGWTIYIDENNDGVLNSTTTGGSPDQTLTVATNLPAPQPIPDQDNSGVQSSLEFTGVGTIEDITVSMDITHTWDSDLRVELISPTGTHVKLVTNRGDDGDNFTNTKFSDSGLVSIASNDAHVPFTGTFRPEESLLRYPDASNRLLGEDASGIWQLWIRDLALGDTGVLNNWSITIKVKGTPGTTVFTEPNTVTDANGNYSFNDLPPGLYHIREYFQPDQVAAGWKQTWAPTPITVTSGANITGQDFGNWIPDVQLAGDYNRDGAVEGSDYVLWRKTLGLTVSSFSGADGDGNGIVEQADLVVWRSNYGQTFPGSGSGSGSATVAAASGAEVQSARVSEPVRATTALDPLSTKQAPLLTQVASDAIVVATSDSAKSAVGSTQVYEIVGVNSTIEHDPKVIERPSEPASRSDVGLLAWLATSSVVAQPQADRTDSDLAISHESNEPESVDIAFELLEGNVLASTTI